MNYLLGLFDVTSFMPHGHCYLWTPALLWIQVGTNALIGVSYLVIAGIIWHLNRRVDDQPFRWAYYAFATFILTCGITHFLDVLVIWEPRYWMDAGVRVVCAAASVATAIALIPLIPEAAALMRGARSAREKGIRLETSIEDLEELYEKSERLEEQKSRFFANLSHELRTPLALIRGRAKQMEESLEEAKDKTHLEAILYNSGLLLKHIDDLLEIARVDGGELEMRPREFDLAGLVRSTAANFDGLAEDYSIDFQVETPEELMVRGDQEKLEGVVVNLLSNAFKFTPDGGEIRCRLRAVGDLEEIGGQSGGRAMLTVDDSGPGVREENREVIFERFRQPGGQDRERMFGAGLGLVLVRDYVELHGGGVAVGDSARGGAQFCAMWPIGEFDDGGQDEAKPDRQRGFDTGKLAEVSVRQFRDVAPEAEEPLADGHADPVEVRVDTPVSGDASVEAVEGPEDSADQGPEPLEVERPSALVVEDNLAMNKFISEILSEVADTASAHDGEEGLRMASRGSFDVILVDLMMPLVDGKTFIQRFRAEKGNHDIPILVVTSKSEETMRTRLLEMGANDYLQKPFSPRELRTRFRNLASMKLTRDVLQKKLHSAQRNLDELARELATRNTELEAAIDTARVARRRAEKASQMKSKLLGMVSHELRTPLTTVTLHLAVLERGEEELSPRQEEVIGKMDVALQNLTELVDALLEKAAIESGQLTVEIERFDAVEMAAELVDHLRDQAEQKGLKLEFEPGEDVGELISDRRLVRLILINLVRNAIKYTEEGRIEVRIDSTERTHLLEVEDTGPGIPKRERGRVFNAFEQGAEATAHQSEGVGLGLSLVDDLVRALGGRIDVDSEVRVGSTFRVEVPSNLQEVSRSSEQSD